MNDNNNNNNKNNNNEIWLKRDYTIFPSTIMLYFSFHAEAIIWRCSIQIFSKFGKIQMEISAMIYMMDQHNSVNFSL